MGNSKASKQLPSVETQLQDIANALMFNSSFTDKIGLLDGKMGVALFLYHYSKYTGQNIYSNYADVLIDQIFEEFAGLPSFGFNSGMAGIGWGIEYLAQNKFVEADADEVLSDLDELLFVNRKNWDRECFEGNELFGFGLYFLARIQGRGKGNKNPMVQKKKVNLVMLAEIYDQLLSMEQPGEKAILSIGTMNSIAYYLLEMHKRKLFLVKINRLIQCLPSYTALCLNKCINKADLCTFLEFSRELMSFVDKDDAKEQYIELIKTAEKQMDLASLDEESKILYYTTSTWHSLIYNTRRWFGEKGAYTDSIEISKIIANEGYVQQKLDQRANDNLGLDNGLAGLGLMLLELANGFGQ